MGCQAFFLKDEVDFVEGVAFCKNCEQAKMEFTQGRLQHKAKEAAPSGLGYVSTEDEKRWESEFDTSTMIAVRTGKARKIKRDIDISKCPATPFGKLMSAVCDLLILGAVFPFYQQDSDPSAWVPEAIVIFIGILAYRVLFTLILGRSFGMILAGVRPVKKSGHPAGFNEALMSGTTFFGCKLVSESGWKRAASSAIYFDERAAKQTLANKEIMTSQTAGSADPVDPYDASPSPKKPPESKSETAPASDPWTDPDWKPPDDFSTGGDPWNDPDWTPPPDPGQNKDPWSDSNA
jgi:hypothetical protein